MIVPNPRSEVIPTAITLSKVLLVEGGTDASFFEALAKTLNLENSIEIRSYQGKNKLGAYLEVFGTMAGFAENVRSVGIVRDADDDAAAAKMSVDNFVKAAKFDKSVSVKVAIVPDHSSVGMLETLCVNSVQTHELYPAVLAFEQSLQTIGYPLPATAGKARHLAQAFLATQKDLQLCPGIAATKGIWPLDHVVFDSMKAFLQSL